MNSKLGVLLVALFLTGCMKSMFPEGCSNQEQKKDENTLAWETIAWTYAVGCQEANSQDQECVKKGIKYADQFIGTP